jgi:phage shock protein PspC (stress-responsive transcriptional regulator)
MNKVVTINLNGNAYQLEELGYEALRAYLDHAARQLEGNPDKDEIIADIEQAIGEKCRALIGPYRTVVQTKQIQQIIAEMGEVDAGASPETNADPKRTADAEESKSNGTRAPVRRIYRIQEGAMLSGVCNGFAAYFNLDPTIIRVAFILLSFLTFGGVVLAYLILSIVLPTATTPDEKAAAQGAPSTAQEFIRRAREGYYEAAKNWGDKHARREWKRKFRYEMRGWGNRFQREMHAHAQTWQNNWQSGWAAHPGAYRGLSFTVALLGLVTAAVTLAWIWATYSLVAKGSVLGLTLPAGMPLWAGIVILFLIFHFAVWPLRATKHALHHGCYGGCRRGGCSGSSDAIVWFVFLGFCVWLADRYVPHAHEAIMNVPPTLHRAADAVREWWHQR